MTPPTTLGALLLVLALVPGWIYLRLVERLQPPSGTSGLHKLLEVSAVGVVTTGVSAITVVLVPHHLLQFTLDVAAWAKDGAYLRTHARAAVASVAMVFGLPYSWHTSCTFSGLSARRGSSAASRTCGYAASAVGPGVGIPTSGCTLRMAN